MPDFLNHLIDKNLDRFQQEVYKNEREILDECNASDLNYSNTILHNLILNQKIDLKLKIKAIFMLCDLSVNVNAQNHKQQTCLHLAIIGYLNHQEKGEISEALNNELYDLTSCLLLNGGDFTIVDKYGLCSYNYLKRIKNMQFVDRLCKLLKIYYPTYWIAIDNQDMNLVRRLVNSWCKFVNIRKRLANSQDYCTIMSYARKKDFQPAICLFEKLAVQMTLCFSVFAQNLAKIQTVLLENNPSLINFNLKNMNDSNATLKYYILKENSVQLVDCLSKYSQKFDSELTKVSDHMLDEKNRNHDVPVLFKLLNQGIGLELLKKIVKPIDEIYFNQIDHTQLRYKGETVLFYAVDNRLDVSILEYLLDYKNCQFELFTIRNSLNLTVFDYIKLHGCNEYIKLFNRILVDYILFSKNLRQQLAYNGFDFDSFINEHEDVFKNNADEELQVFLSKLKNYQKTISRFHQAVELNKYDDACELSHFSGDDDGMDFFISDLIDSRANSHNQSVIHRAVLNQNTKLLEFLLGNRKTNLKMDMIRDHCFRTPLHYAFGIRSNKTIVTMLLDYGFSENVFDKDGMSPLDFHERQESEEVQQLISLHKAKIFDQIEPNPWSFNVWTRLQTEKDSSKQITLFNSKIINHHHHGHGHWPTGRGHHHHCHGEWQQVEEDEMKDDENNSCNLS